MNILVVYKSISGFTKKYAEWIAGGLNAKCINLDEIGNISFKEYDLIIFGGSLHAVGVNGYKKFKAYIPIIGADKIIIFAVGASPAKKGVEDEIKTANLTDAVERNIPLFYLRGGFDYSKLDLRNKVLMKLLKWKLMLRKNKTPDEKGMLSAYKKPLDASKQKNIEPIIDYVKGQYHIE
jgi:menaquinone-dependent protoporphyrinogen IX oxidase